jgi:uncharacterized protein YecT (DUF1311 family)
MPSVKATYTILAILPLWLASPASADDGPPIAVADCGIALSASLPDEANFSNVGLDPVKFRQVSAPKFLGVLSELCRTSPKHQALVASRVKRVVLAAAPGADEITVYVRGKILTVEFPDAGFHAASFRKSLAAALEAGWVAKPSFDCAKATAPADRLICSDPDLTDADFGLGEIYKDRLKQDKADPNKLAAWRRSQKDWVAARDHDCLAGHDAAALDPDAPAAQAIIACLTAATNARSDALQKPLFNPEAGTPAVAPAR